jgi:hypothetical protein
MHSDIQRRNISCRRNGKHNRPHMEMCLTCLSGRGPDHARPSEPQQALCTFSKCEEMPDKETIFMLSIKGNFYNMQLWTTNKDLLWIIFIIYSFELTYVKISDSFQTFKFCLDFCLFLKMKRGDYNKLNLFVI